MLAEIAVVVIALAVVVATFPNTDRLVFWMETSATLVVTQVHDYDCTINMIHLLIIRNQTIIISF